MVRAECFSRKKKRNSLFLSLPSFKYRKKKELQEKKKGGRALEARHDESKTTNGLFRRQTFFPLLEHASTQPLFTTFYGSSYLPSIFKKAKRLTEEDSLRKLPEAYI